MRRYKTRRLSVVFFAVFMMWQLAGCQQGESTTAKLETEPAQPAPVETMKTPAQAVPVQAAPATPAVAPENAPVIQVGNSSVNFGQVGPNSIHKATYDFTNSGKTVLSVANIQSTCGCSMPALTKDGQKYPAPLKEPILYEPGQSGQVEVTFTAPAVKGSTTKHLYIVSNDPAKPRAELSLTAEVMVKVSVSPESVNLRFDQENAGMSTLTVKSTDGQEFSIMSASIANGVMTVPFDAGVKKTEFVLEPTVNLDKLKKFNTGVIQIKTDHPQAGMLLVRYTAQPEYEVSRPRIILQNVEPQVPIVKDVIIRSNYDKVAEVASVKSRNGYMTVESQEQDGKNVKMMVKITPPDRDSSARRYITDELIVTLKNGEELPIRCSGWFRQN